MKKYIYILYVLCITSLSLPYQGVLGACDTGSLEPVRYGERSEGVKTLQSCLIQMGYDIIAPTGYYGRQTANAVKGYYSTWYGAWNGMKLGPAGIAELQKRLTSSISTSSDFTKFSSEQEYKDYVKEAMGSNYYSYVGLGREMMMVDTSTVMPPTPTAAPMEEKVAERYSETNVQVLGIDEPDIVKNNGQMIFYKTDSYRTTVCPEGAMCIMGMRNESKVNLIKALPVENLSITSSITSDSYGENLLLDGNNLVVLGSKVKGYDVSDVANPAEKWSLELSDGARIVTARMYGGKIYLVTASYPDASICSVTPFKGMPGISCNEIYYPRRGTSIDSNYVVMSIDPTNGNITDKFSFLGSNDSSVIYMSDKGLYVAYGYNEDILSYYVSFLKGYASDLIPAQVITRLDTIAQYDITNESKWNEFQTELNKYYNSLDKDEALRVRNEFNNRLKDYSKSHYRDLEKTAIVKMDLGTLSITSNGNVPGRLLNQFSMDEYNGILRVATTIGGGWNRFGVSAESVSDVYTLDASLNILGSVKGLGATERIYSVRFLGNMGYVVTFRQVDPFYVLDLSDPSNPAQKGELKIPGYSSYLHPITDNQILGIGKEDSKVKISLFDVSSPSNPTEISKYSLDDYWTEIESNHHAFLIDKKHGIFFIPGSSGGYVFSYEGGNISLVKTLSGHGVKRALYINDYMYMLGNDKITVFNENTWEKVKELELK